MVLFPVETLLKYSLFDFSFRPKYHILLFHSLKVDCGFCCSTGLTLCPDNDSVSGAFPCEPLCFWFGFEFLRRCVWSIEDSGPGKRRVKTDILKPVPVSKVEDQHPHGEFGDTFSLINI